MTASNGVVLHTNRANVLDGVKVEIKSVNRHEIVVEVNAAGDRYETKIELKDRVWLGDSRWRLVEIFETRKETVREFGSEETPAARLIHTDRNAEAKDRVDSVGEFVAEVELSILKRLGY